MHNSEQNFAQFTFMLLLMIFLYMKMLIILMLFSKQARGRRTGASGCHVGDTCTRATKQI